MWSWQLVCFISGLLVSWPLAQRKHRSAWLHLYHQPVPHIQEVPAGSVLSQQHVALCTNRHGSAQPTDTERSQWSGMWTRGKQREDAKVGKIMPVAGLGWQQPVHPLVVTGPRWPMGREQIEVLLVQGEKGQGWPNRDLNTKSLPPKEMGVGVLHARKEIDWQKELPLSFPESRLCLQWKASNKRAFGSRSTAGGNEGLTWFIFAFNVIACDGAVPIKAHGPPEGDGACLHVFDLNFRRIWGLCVVNRKPGLVWTLFSHKMLVKIPSDSQKLCQLSTRQTFFFFKPGSIFFLITF